MGRADPGLSALNPPLVWFRVASLVALFKRAVLLGGTVLQS